MLDAIRKLGNYIIKDEGLSREAILTEVWKLKDARIICIIFEFGNGQLTYKGIHLEEYDSGKSEKYLYRTFSHGLYDVTPTTRVISLDKVKKRTLLWFKIYSEKYRDNQLIQSLADEVNRKSENIFSDMSKVYNELSRDERNVILTIKIREKGEDHYLGDYPIFRSIFKDESLRKFSFKYKVESKGVGICYLCGKRGEVLGFAIPFSFYTFDKQGFAPNFLQEEAWKSSPICATCAISLVAGKKFLNEHLLKNFDRFKFYVIPKFIFGEIKEDVIEDIKNADKKRYAESLLWMEDYVLYFMKEKEDVFGLVFMFIKPKQKDYFDIVQYVEDVPPSWIKKLYDALKDIKSLSLFKEDMLKKIFGKRKVGGLDSDLTIGRLIRPFFPGPDYDKYFIEIIGDILNQRTIDRNLLTKAFVREIRYTHVNEKVWDEKLLCLKSFMLLLFLNKLQLTGYARGEQRGGRKS